MMNYQEYIKSELLILIPALYFIGTAIKKSSIADKWIPVILGTISVILTSLWVAYTSDISSLSDAACAIFISVTQGVLIAGASVYVNQIFVQSKKNE